MHNNFLDLYLYHTGRSEVPRRYHLWCALSILAASVADRVWVRVSEAKRVYPNLYVFLVGPSGCGKGAAIDVAMKLVEGMDVLHLYSGMATKQAFIDYLAKDAVMDGDDNKTARRPNAYFVTEELAMSLPQGDLAYGLLTFMTGVYMRPSQPIIEGTRSRGRTTIVQPTTNWLAGSNEVWLVESVPKSAMESGFLARVCLVQARRDRSVRHPRMQVPADYAEAVTRLQAWLQAYTWVEGEYTLSDDALTIHDKWYMERPDPEDRALEPSFFRADEMVYKLALLFALTDWQGQFDGDGKCREHQPVVSGHHMSEAIEAWTDLTFDIGGVVEMAATTPQSADVTKVREIIERAGTIDRSTLMRKVGGCGLNRDRLDRALATLFDAELIGQANTVTTDNRAKRGYTWLDTELHRYAQSLGASSGAASSSSGGVSATEPGPTRNNENGSTERGSSGSSTISTGPTSIKTPIPSGSTSKASFSTGTPPSHTNDEVGGLVACERSKTQTDSGIRSTSGGQ